MPDHIQIRPMTMLDYEAAFALWERTEGLMLNASDEPEAVAMCLAANPGMSHVAYLGDQLCGTLLCSSDGRRGYLNHLAVDEPDRRQGVGQALIEACLATLRELGIKRCNLMVLVDNHVGIEFWIKRGWYERTQLRMMSLDLE